MNRRIVLDSWLVSVAGLAFWVALLAGCILDRPDAITPPPLPPATVPTTAPELPPEASNLERAQARADALARELAAALIDVDSAKAAEHRARLDGLRRLAWWVAGIAMLGVFACAAVAIVVPVFRTVALSAGLACIVVEVLALGFDRLLPWMPLIGITVAAGGAAWMVYLLIVSKRATREAAAHGDRLEKALTDWGRNVSPAKLLATVKTISAKSQDRAGVRKLVAHARNRPVKPVADLAEITP